MLPWCLPPCLSVCCLSLSNVSPHTLFTFFNGLFSSIISFIQQLEKDNLKTLICCKDQANLLSLFALPTSSSNKSSTALKAIDSEMVWCNYQAGWRQRLPVK